MSCTGSPPLTRERHFYKSHIYLQHRITPAYAGKTWLLLIGTLSVWDHPRLRGKDCPIRFRRIKLPGSPPLTRERQNCTKHSVTCNRITPAYAGKTDILA